MKPLPERSEMSVPPGGHSVWRRSDWCSRSRRSSCSSSHRSAGPQRQSVSWRLATTVGLRRVENERANSLGHDEGGARRPKWQPDTAGIEAGVTTGWGSPCRRPRGPFVHRLGRCPCRRFQNRSRGTRPFRFGIYPWLLLFRELPSGRKSRSATSRRTVLRWLLRALISEEFEEFFVASG